MSDSDPVPARSLVRPPFALLLIASYALLVLSAAILATGGGVAELAGLRLSMTKPLAPAVAGLVLLGAAAALRRQRLAGDLASAWPWIERRSGWLAAMAAVALFLAGVWFGTFAAAGADSSGYISEAALLARGARAYHEPLAASSSWPDAATTLAPLGYRAGHPTGTLVPTYPPGLPLAMAAPIRLAGPLAAFVIVPLLAALAVWATWRIGALVLGPVTGLVAAAWLASSPITLYQAMQPMSDVPAMAWWTLATLGLVVNTPATIAGAGLAAGAALLTRPNLLPLAAFMGLILLGRRDGSPVAARVRAMRIFALGVLPFVASVLWWQRLQFGSPWSTGYGSLPELFDPANVPANARLYAAWLTRSESPLVWLAVAAPVLIARFHSARPAGGHTAPVSAPAAAAAGLGLVAMTVACYLPYGVFENWTYVRFLLPTLPLTLLLASSVIVGAIRRAPPAVGLIVLVLLLPALVSRNVATASRHDVFGLQARDRRFALAGRYLDGLLPFDAVVLAGEHSGAVRYYTGRTVLRWDLLRPDACRAALAELTAQRRPVFLVLDDWEEPALRTRLGEANAVAALDWPPVADVGERVRTRIYAAADRSRYFAGASPPVDRLR